MSKEQNPVDVEVGARIRLLRQARNMSQEALSEHLGVSYQQVQKYEKGTNRVSASRLQKIAEVLGVRASDFFPAEGAQAAMALTGLSSQAVSLAKIYDALPAVFQRALRAMAAALQDQALLDARSEVQQAAE